MMSQVGGQFPNQSSNSNYGGMFNSGGQQQMNQYGGMQQGSQMNSSQQLPSSINITPLSDMDNNLDPCFQQMVRRHDVWTTCCMLSFTRICFSGAKPPSL